MICTILIGSYISVQGLFEAVTSHGNMIVRVGDRTYEGKPVGNRAEKHTDAMASAG